MKISPASASRKPANRLRSGLAATRGAEQRQELALLHLESGFLQGGHRAKRFTTPSRRTAEAAGA